MTIREYIDKNLTSLNWNILPQIFESEGVELTEEIEKYLRETPKNTNWNVFKDLGGKNSSFLLTEEITLESRSIGPGEYIYTGTFIYNEEINYNSINVYIDDIKYTVSKNEESNNYYDSFSSYGDKNYNNVPFYISSATLINNSNHMVSVFNAINMNNSGTHLVKIEINN